MNIKTISRYLLICGVMGSSVRGIAQDTTGHKMREYYMSFGGFSPLNVHLKYKKQIREKLFFKIGLVSLSANITQSGSISGFPVNNENYSGGLEFGFEWRKTIARKLILFHGPALRGVYQITISRRLDPSIPQEHQVSAAHTLHGSIPYAIGFLYPIYQNLFLSAEITPSLYFSYQNNLQNPPQQSYNFNAGLGFDNRVGLISLVFRH